MNGSSSGCSVPPAANANGGADGTVQQAQHRELLSAMSHLLDRHMEGMREEMKGMKRAMDIAHDEVRSVRKELSCLKDEVEKLRGECKGKHDSEELPGTDFRQHVDSRFDCLEDRQMYHEILLKNREWRYSAHIPDYDSDDEDDEDEDNDERERNRFHNSMKDATCGMKHGTDNGRVEIRGHTNLDHDESDMPHWDELTDALDEYRHALKCWPKGSSLGIFDVKLEPNVLDSLEDALESTHFNGLYLENNRFGSAGIDFVLNIVKNNHNLIDLSLTGNDMTPRQMNGLCEIIKSHSTIETVELINCFDEVRNIDMLRAIMTAGSAKLKHIDFSENLLVTDERSFIADFLASNDILESLVINGNHLSDEDIQSIAGALKKNTSLLKLDLGHRDAPLSDVGFDALKKAEYDPTTLNSAADSNHICNIKGISRFNKLDIRDDELLRKATRGIKIFRTLSLSRRDNPIHIHLDDLPVELFPHMLSSIQKYWEYTDKYWGRRKAKSLSYVFEIMRRWDRAFSLYKSLSGAETSKI